jgi:hypothetical protein
MQVNSYTYGSRSRYSAAPISSLPRIMPSPVQREGRENVSPRWNLAQFFRKTLDRFLPKQGFDKHNRLSKTLPDNRPTLYRRVLNSLPDWLSNQFEDRNKERTVKYVTWIAPAIIYPPMTYFATSDKQKEGKDNLLRQYSRYAVGPFIQLGIDGLFFIGLSRFTPQWFEHKTQAELTSFLAAYLCYTGWETYGVQQTVETGRRFMKTGPSVPHVKAHPNPKLN